MLLDRLSRQPNQHFMVGDVCVYCSPDVEVTRRESGDYSDLSFRCGDDSRCLFILLSVPLHNAASFWAPGSHNRGIDLPTDWSVTVPVSLVNSAPLGCLMDASENTILGFAYSDGTSSMDYRYGVDEEHASFTVSLRIQKPQRDSVLRITRTGQRFSRVMSALSEWMNTGCEPLPVAQKAEEPVFSTWYAYLQQVDARSLETEAPKIAQMGCRSIFIDDGWQKNAHGRGYKGCGDWIPDTQKFPDLKGTIDRLHEEGLGVVLWTAPLLLGEKADVYEQMRPYAPVYRPGPENDMHILDPRRQATRDFVAQTCARIIQNYGADGLKIDFLDSVTVYEDSPLESSLPGDISNVGNAMLQLLTQVKESVSTVLDGKAPIIEFRQPYSSPDIAPFSNIIRASDCPADSVTNRVRTVDERLISHGRVVHGDMLLWNPGDRAEACAQQIMGSFFAVPQLSVPPSAMSEEQFRTCRYLLGLWEQNKDIILGGDLVPEWQSLKYPVVRATRREVQVIGRYASLCTTVSPRFRASQAKVIILNSTGDSVVPVQICQDQHCSMRTVSFTCKGEKLVDKRRSISPGDVLMNLPSIPYGVLCLSFTVEEKQGE